MAAKQQNGAANAPAGGDVTEIGRIDVPKASDLLAERIREQILTGTFAEGDQLPTERELSVQTGLGRSSIREALRILENQSLIETRPGRNGGSLVRRPDRTSLESSIALFIRGRQLRLTSLLEAREAVEPAAARLAALHRSERDLAHLVNCQRQLDAASHHNPAFLAANIEWHLAVVAASHNELLIAFMTAISQALLAATDIVTFDSDKVRSATLHIHERVLAAIKARDPDAAERRMRRHVQAYADVLQDRPAPRKRRSVAGKARSR